jgi:hypothetical protein
MDIHTFYFATVQTKGFKRIKPSKRLAANKLIDVTNYTYHPDFWENNPFLNKYPLDPDIKKSLESGGDLESQFSQASPH